MYEQTSASMNEPQCILHISKPVERLRGRNKAHFNRIQLKAEQDIILI